MEENEPKRKDEFKMQYFVAHKKETFLNDWLPRCKMDSVIKVNSQETYFFHSFGFESVIVCRSPLTIRHLCQNNNKILLF